MHYFTLKVEFQIFCDLSNLKLKVSDSSVSKAPNDLGNKIHDINKTNNNNDSNNDNNIIIIIIIIIIMIITFFLFSIILIKQCCAF